MYFKDYITYINESYKTASKYAHDERLTYTYSSGKWDTGPNDKQNRARLAKIKEIDASGIFKNERQIPNDFNRYVNLENLILRNNKDFHSIPTSIFDLTYLQILDMWNCDVQSIPDEIEKLIFLKEINLRSNTLTHISPNIGKLERMVELLVGGNYLKSIPDEIGMMKSLETLDVGDSMLTKLPSTIGDLTKLEILDISDNKLETLPRSLLKLNNLKEFVCDGNPIKDLDPIFIKWHFFKDIPLSDLTIENWYKLFIGSPILYAKSVKGSYDTKVIGHKDCESDVSEQMSTFKNYYFSLIKPIRLELIRYTEDNKPWELSSKLQELVIDAIGANEREDIKLKIIGILKYMLGISPLDTKLQHKLMDAVKHAGLNYIDFKQFVNDDVWNSHRGRVRMQNMKDI